jgi:hypothetical protein
MAKAKAPKPNSPAATSATGNQPSQVGAGTQPAGSSSLPAGSAAADQAPNNSEPRPDDVDAGTEDEITQDLRVHAAAVQSDIPSDVLLKACAPRPEISDVLTARRYPDRWVLVVMSATRAFKVEVPHEA